MWQHPENKFVGRYFLRHHICQSTDLQLLRATPYCPSSDFARQAGWSMFLCNDSFFTSSHAQCIPAIGNRLLRNGRLRSSTYIEYTSNLPKGDVSLLAASQECHREALNYCIQPTHSFSKACVTCDDGRSLYPRLFCCISGVSISI